MAEEKRSEGSTLSEEEIRRKIRRGEITSGDLTIQQRERFRRELKEARRY